MFWICIIVQARIHNAHFKRVAWSIFFSSSLPQLTITAPFWETAVSRLISLVTVLTQNLSVDEKGRSVSPSLPWGTVLDNHCSGIEQLLSVTFEKIKSCNQCFLTEGGCFLLPVDSANTRLLLHSKCSLKWISSSSRVNAIHWLSYEIFCRVVYCMQFYRQTDECVLVWCIVECLLCGVLCPVVCVCACVCAGMCVFVCCESDQPFFCFVFGYFSFFFCFLFLFFFPDDKTAFHLSCKQFRCIDVPSMHMPLVYVIAIKKTQNKTKWNSAL